MKVLFIHCTSDVSGGSDFSLFELVKSLNKNIIEPVMLLRKFDPMITRYESMGLKVYTVRFNGPPKKIFSTRALLFLANIIPVVIRVLYVTKNERPNIVHVNTSLNIQGGLGAFLTRLPFVWHIREILGSGLLDTMVKSVVCKFSTKTISISQAVKESYKCVNTIVVYNGIDLAKYKNLVRDVNTDSITISCLGRIESFKGQHVLLESIPIVLETFNSIKVQFIGGPASAKPEYLDGLVKRVSELGLTNYVSFLGIRNDVPELLSKTDVLVVPTTSSGEPFGRTIIEGMAAGCVVIATSIGGPLEIIENNKTGFLVKPSSVNELAQKLIEVISNKSECCNIRERAFEDVRRNYDIERVGARMEQVFIEMGK